MDANVAAVICAAIAMFASTVGAVLQYRATLKQKQAELDANTNKELEQAKQELEKSKRLEAERAFRAEMQDMNRALATSVDNIAKSVSDMEKHVKGLDERMEKLDVTMERRMTTHEERMRAIVEVLSKNARTFSALVRAQRQTDTRLETIMEVESYNLRFSQETAGALAVVGELLAEQVESAGATDTEMFRLREALKTAKGAQSGFTEKILNAQVAFIAKDPASNQKDTAGDAEVDAIHSIMRKQPVRAEKPKSKGKVSDSDDDDEIDLE